MRFPALPDWPRWAFYTHCTCCSCPTPALHHQAFQHLSFIWLWLRLFPPGWIRQSYRKKRNLSVLLSPKTILHLPLEKNYHLNEAGAKKNNILSSQIYNTTAMCIKWQSFHISLVHKYLDSNAIFWYFANSGIEIKPLGKQSLDFQI